MQKLIRRNDVYEYINVQEQQYKKPDAGAVIGGILAGSMVKNFVGIPYKYGAPIIVNKLVELSSNLSVDEFA